MKRTQSARLRCLGLTQKEAAEELGVSEDTLARRLRRKDPATNQALKGIAYRDIMRYAKKALEAYEEAESYDLENP